MIGKKDGCPKIVGLVHAKRYLIQGKKLVKYLPKYGGKIYNLKIDSFHLTNFLVWTFFKYSDKIIFFL